MKTHEEIPEAVRTTMATFVELLRRDQQRQRELQAEIAAVSLRQRVIGATEDASWLTERFLWPRLEELRTVEARMALTEARLAHMREEWERPRSQVNWAWVPSDSPSILSLVA